MFFLRNSLAVVRLMAERVMPFAFAILLSPAFALAATEEIVLDAVLASVDGRPITLQEVTHQLVPQRTLSLKEAALDVEARRVLDTLIMDYLIEAEAESRKLKVSDQEVEGYLNEVARRNGLSRDAFEVELRHQVGDLEAYQRRVRVEILRSKIISQLVHSPDGVTSSEIQQYISDHPELAKSGTKVRLRQIFIDARNRPLQEAQERTQEVMSQLAQGEDFEQLARQYAESGTEENDGLLGVVAEEDLSPSVFDAIFGLKEEEFSQPVPGNDGIRIFRVEKRYVEQDNQNPELEAEVRKLLERQKQQGRLEHFFTVEIMKLHAVDKKI